MQFQVLGPLAVVLDDETVHIGPPVQRRVLAALLVRRGETVSRRTLIQDVWSGDAEAFDAWELEERKRGALFSYIARLRVALEPVARSIGRDTILVTDHNGYRLVLDDKYVDETEFRNLVMLGHEALEAGQPAAAAQRFDLALGMWRGEPLGDLHTEPFARETAARLDALRRGALESRAEAHLTLHRHRDLVADAGLRRWVEQYPASERLHHALALALHRCGQTAGAVAACRDGITLVEGGGIAAPRLRDLLDELSIPARSAEPAPPRDPLDAAAEALARTVRWQWQAEVAVRQLPDPYPIPVRWRSSRPDGAATLRSDQISSVAAHFEGLHRRRMVVLGPAGSGKSTLAIMLTVELAAHRRPADPVPVLLSLSTWDPAAEHLHAWLRRKLAEEYSVLLDSARFGATAIHDLVADRRILPVLDGLDELPATRRVAALRAVNRSLVAEDSVVLTSRPAEYHAAVAGGESLTGATTIEAQPVRVEDAAEYLRQSGSSRRWTPILATSAPDAPLAEALTSPLVLMLTRLVYTGSRDPAGLADTARFPGRAAIEDHLLDAFVPALVEQDRHRDGRTRLRAWDAGAISDWLVFLARLAYRQGTYDITWWRLPEAVRPLVTRTGRSLVAAVLVGFVGVVVTAPRAIAAYGLAGGLVSCVNQVLSYGLGTMAAGLCTEPSPPSGPPAPGRGRRVVAGALRTGLAGGCTLGLVEGLGDLLQGSSVGFAAYTVIAYGLGMAVAFGMGGVIATVPSPTAIDVSLRGRGRALLRMLCGGLAVGVTVGLAIGGVEEATVAIVRHVHVTVDDDLVIGLLPGLVFGVVAGTASALIHWARKPIVLEEAHSLRSTLAADRRQYLGLLGMVTVTVVVAFTLGAVVSLEAGLADNIRHGVEAGLGGSIVLALASCSTAAWPRYQVARLWLAAHRRLPWRLVAFLEEAQRIGVLRRLGATYQFRHASLQDRMAAHPPGGGPPS